MPEPDSTRKRSRSPSDTDQPKHKRANTGATSYSDDSQARSLPARIPLPSIPASNNDANMDMHTSVDDTAASTPSPRHSRDDTNSGSADKMKVETNVTGDGTADGASSATTSGAPSSSSSAPGPPSANIHMRCLIVTQDASIIIGKAGSHVNEIREKSGARVMVSESIPGNPERILNVSGPLDAVSKVCRNLHYRFIALIVLVRQAFGLIVRRINDEPFDKASVPGSRAVTIKFMIPNSRMGSVIGKGGTKIKEIQDASGARLNASEGMLPGSTEVRKV